MAVRQSLPEWLNGLPQHLGRPFAYITFGQAVSRKRREGNQSQAELACRIGISRNYLSLIERDESRNISLPIFVRLAQALEVDECELLKIYLATQQGPPASTR
jgi:transcriptional regulator with XRE-family HTH domain